MTAILRALNAAYNFFAGDVILLAATALAFTLGLLAHAVIMANRLVALIYVGVIVAGLALTLGRELRGRKRQR